MRRVIDFGRGRSVDLSRMSSDNLLTRPVEPSFSAISEHFSRMATREKPSEKLCLAPCIKAVIDATFTKIFMTILTIYVLFADDVRLLAFSLRHDDYFFGIATCALVLFTLEIGLSLYAQPGYRFSFYFVLDVLATLSLLSDIGWVWDPLVGSMGTTGGSQASQIRDAGRASRTGARTTRVIRIVRLIRLVRLVKLYKSARSPFSPAVQRQVTTTVTEYTIPKESRIGQKLSDLTIKRVIVLVLSLLIVLPVFELSLYKEQPTSWAYGMKVLEKSAGSKGFETVFAQYVDYHKGDTRPLVFMSYIGSGFSLGWQGSASPDALRFAEKAYRTTDSFVAVFDLRADTRMEAGLNICQTVLISLVLALSALYLTHDTNKLVIVPIEKMMDKVHRLAKNPLVVGDEKLMDVYDCEHENTPWFRWGRNASATELETSILEKTILKIGALLALSLGEAGSRIIASSLDLIDYFDPIIEGDKTVAIFSFCDIRNFTDVTEVLEEGVMVFVNEVASILHHTVDQHLGAANINIGDAFLLVWKIDNEHLYQDNEELCLADSDMLSNFADLTLICILKVLSQIGRDTRMEKYQENHSILERLPNYKVRLGFGLHLGWAIEGPIGTLMKIDASYLSPHVNMTMKLQELTKYYGVPLVVSGAVFGVLSQQAKEMCRHIDTVMIKGTNIVLKVYTFDVNLTALRRPRETVYSLRKSKAKRRRLKEALQDENFRAWELFSTSRKIKLLRQVMSQDFLRWFHSSITYYESGEWEDGYKSLQEALRLNPLDGPSKALFGYMSSEGFQAPKSWPGYRELRDK